MSHIVAAPFYHLKAVRDGKTVAYWSRVFGWVRERHRASAIPANMLDDEREFAHSVRPLRALVAAEPTR